MTREKEELLNLLEGANEKELEEIERQVLRIIQERPGRSAFSSEAPESPLE